MAADRPTFVDPFEHFAGLPFYKDLNQEFVDSLDLQPGSLVVDLACGPGNVTRLIAEKIGSQGLIYAVDMSSVAIKAARRNLENLPATVNFVEGRAEDLYRLVDGASGVFDAVVCGNAIHNFSDKAAAVSAVWDLLKEGGTFAMNSTFYDGAVPEDQNDFYRAWMFNARASARDLAKSLGETVAPAGRVRAEARKQMTPEEYENLLESAGFQIQSRRVIPVDMPLEGFQAISEDSEFAEGARPREVPLEIIKQTLAEAATDVFKARRILSSQRNWLEIIAVKPPTLKAA